MKSIESIEACEEAAKELGVCFYQAIDNSYGNEYPHGCTYNAECGELTWDSPTANYAANLDCGTRYDEQYVIECLCFSIGNNTLIISLNLPLITIKCSNF